MNIIYHLSKRKYQTIFLMPSVLIVLSITLCMVILFSRQSNAAQKDTRSLAPLNRFPRMVQEYFVNQVKQSFTVSKERIRQLNNKSDALIFLEETQNRIQKCFGPWPEKLL